MINRYGIVEMLETVRKVKGLRQEDLAKLAGTSRVTVGRVEAGFDPRLSTVYELARALGLELTLVPKALAGEVQAFIQSGGEVLGQPSGVAAPESVVAQALRTNELNRLRETSPRTTERLPRPVVRTSSESVRVHKTDNKEYDPQAPAGSGASAAKFGAMNAAQAGLSLENTSKNGPTISASALARLGINPSKTKPK